jgi:hypothetical protein
MSEFVALATANDDLGIVLGVDAERIAEDFANETGQPVTLRDSVSDDVITTIEPVARARSSAR